MPDVQEMYNMWLSGKSIRKIAYYFNIGRGTVQLAFRKAYGKDACNLRMQGLARVVYREYGDKLTAEKAKNTAGLYMSQKTMDNHSKAYRNVKIDKWEDEEDGADTYYDYVQDWVPDTDLEHEEGVLLPYYLWIVQNTTDVIGAIYMNARADSVNISI